MCLLRLQEVQKGMGYTGFHSPPMYTISWGVACYIGPAFVVQYSEMEMFPCRTLCTL